MYRKLTSKLRRRCVTMRHCARIRRVFQCNNINAAASQSYQRKWRRRLRRDHARVCRIDSLSADHVPFERCANARIVRDCLGWMQLIQNTAQSSTYVWRWRQSKANPSLIRNSLLTGKITGNFAPSGGSNRALLLVDAHPEPISSHHTSFLRKSEQGINRGVTGKEQGIVFGWAGPSRPDLVIRHPQVLRQVKVQQAPCSMLDHDKDVKQLERGGDRHEEVTGKDRLRLVS